LKGKAKAPPTIEEWKDYYKAKWAVKLWWSDKLIPDMENLTYFEDMFEKYHKQVTDASPVKKVALLYDFARQCTHLQGLSKSIYQEFGKQVDDHFRQDRKNLLSLLEIEMEIENIRTMPVTGPGINEEWSKKVKDGHLKVKDVVAALNRHEYVDESFIGPFCSYVAKELEKKSNDTKKSFLVRWYWRCLSVSAAANECGFLNLKRKLCDFHEEELNGEWIDNKGNLCADISTGYRSGKLHIEITRSGLWLKDGGESTLKLEKEGELGVFKGRTTNGKVYRLELDVEAESKLVLRKEGSNGVLTATKAEQVQLRYTVLGTRLNKIYEDGLLAPQSMYTNMDFDRKMDQLGLNVMAQFGIQLSSLKGQLAKKCSSVAGLKAKALAAFFAMLQLAFALWMKSLLSQHHMDVGAHPNQ